MICATLISRNIWQKSNGYFNGILLFYVVIHISFSLISTSSSCVHVSSINY